MNTAKGLDAIVVMTEAARGFDANWWNAKPDASIAQLGALLASNRVHLACDRRRPPPSRLAARRQLFMREARIRLRIAAAPRRKRSRLCCRALQLLRAGRNSAPHRFPRYRICLGAAGQRPDGLRVAHAPGRALDLAARSRTSRSSSERLLSGCRIKPAQESCCPLAEIGPSAILRRAGWGVEMAISSVIDLHSACS